jgi:beta-carotene 3-hydroxylase
MIVLINTLLALLAFLFMETVAWASHKYVMHGFLWILHRDHHIRDGRKMEWNDVFAVIFALPSIWLIYLGFLHPTQYYLGPGIGILCYGMAYFLFHDVYVHKRVPTLNGLSNRYLRATLKAHLDHHLPGAEYNFGFLVAPFKYYKKEFSK